MKKLSIALALILCLVLCVFCFASCKKKNNNTSTTAAPTTGTPTTVDPGTTATEPADTTAPDVTQPPEHTHVRATEYTIDTPATCGAAGSQSYHCTICNEIIPETVVPIPATGNHTMGEWVVTTPASVIADGVQTKTCTVCGHKDTQAISKTAASIQTWTPETTGKYSNSKTLAEIQGDKHFYPTADNAGGNDLLIEYSLLWNDTLLNLAPGTDGPTSPYVTTQISKPDGSDDNTLTWWSLTNDVYDSWCKFAGGFEAGCLQRVAPDGAAYTPIGMCASGGNYAAYPNIGGADKDNPEYGWHRFGLRFHQEVVNESIVRAGGAAIYEFTLTLYFDGVPVSMLIGKTTADQKVPKDVNYLFTAEYDETDGIKYSDNANADRTVFAILVNTMVAKADTVAYWADADYAYTCGKDFVQKVAPSNNAEDVATIELASGVTKSAKAWYKLVDGSAAHDHVYNVEGEVTKAATLLENGTKVMKCAYCDETQTVEYEYYPEVFKWDKNARDRYSPNQATLGEIRGDKHFYDAGNDLLVEYSFLWNETTVKLRGDKQCYLDTRLTNSDGGRGKNIAYWSPSSNINMSDCKYAGSFEYGGIAQNMPDNPYPGFNSGVNDGDLYPNIGGENNGDGTEQRNDLYGWHRISLRYREEVTNKEALMADTTAGATAATYNLELWVYIDGKLVIHAYGTDLISTEDGKPDEDRKLFSAASNGAGGIVYTENDALVLHPVCLNSKRALDNKTAYYSVADVSVTVGSEFTQKVMRLSDPTPAELAVVGGTTVTSTMWYTLAHEHVWDGNFTETEAATLLNDGEKVEHCSVCGEPHFVVVPFVAEYTDSKAIAGSKYADNGNKDVAALKSAADIRGDKHFAPTADDEDGNDLWFEYSFLYNETLRNRDNPDYLAEMRLFGFRSASTASNYRGFYYIYFLNDKDKGPKDGAFDTSNDCPWAGHIDFSTYYPGSNPGQNCALDLTSEGNTLNGKPIGRYIAGWGAGRDDAPYLWDSKYQPMGGWHRLGFHYHQEAEIVDGAVRYSGYTELFIDGVKCWKVLTNMEGYLKSGQWKDTDWSLKGKNLLLWTAAIDPEDNTKLIYTENDDVRVGFRIDRLDTSSQSVFVGIDDVQWTCGDGFVREVVRVDNPKPVKIQVAAGVEVDGAMYFTYPHAHVWDEDYTVTTEATLLNEGVKADHCSICGETRETVFAAADPYTISSSMTAADRTAYNTANNVDWLNHTDLPTGIYIKKNINDIKAADQHYYPTEGNDQGNDLLVEVSYLWNNTCSVFTWETFTFGDGDGYDVFNCADKISPKVRAGFTYEFITPTPAEIEADESVKTPSIGGYGWHRLGFRVHQDAEIVADAVKYTYIASAYVDGTKVVEYDLTDWVVKQFTTGTVTALLYTAKIVDGALVYYDIGANTDSTFKNSYALLFFEEFFNTNGAYCVFTDLNMSCGHDFVQQVKKVADPADATYEITTGVEVSGKIWYEFAD